MSIHSSLKATKKPYRSVLKRHERLAKAIRERNWLLTQGSYKLPKFNPPKLKFAKKKDETLGENSDIQANNIK